MLKNKFGENYWSEYYSAPEEMDNVMNAKEHAAYIKAIFDLEQIDVNSVMDWGFGMGKLFYQVLKVFKPFEAFGIEPSSFIFDKTAPVIEKNRYTPKVKLLNCDLLTWSEKNFLKKPVDLGLCTSVWQYIETEDLKKIIPEMAKSCRYLYLSVPTDIEYQYQINELAFHDQLAIHRTKLEYYNLIRPYFTFVSSRLLESKIVVKENDGYFNDHLFRF